MRVPARFAACRCLLLCGLLALSPAARAEADPQAARKLAAVREQIEALQAEMRDTRDRHGQLQTELQRIEQGIGEFAKTLDDITRHLAAKRQTLAGLEKRRADQERQLAEQRRVLAQQIRAAYQMGRQDYLKILLNQEDPARLGRVLTYYDYFNRARAAQIAQINQTLERIVILQNSIREETRSLQDLQGRQQAQKQQLEAGYQERREILGNLHATLDNQASALRNMLEDKRRLEKLLNAVQGAFAGLPAPEADAAGAPAFVALKGRLRRPVAGKIVKSFGDERGLGALKWQGMLIAAAPGEKVRAVSAGRVVFAGWFRNYGQMLILDHAEGYMSLYGYNQSLYKQTGDWVAAGEEIASVGDSGGQAASGLYFEIRHQGAPLNPRPWFREP